MRNSETESPTGFESPMSPRLIRSIRTITRAFARISRRFASHFENVSVCLISIILDNIASYPKGYNYFFNYFHLTVKCTTQEGESSIF